MKLSEEAKVFIDQQMRSNDEMTSAQILKKLAKRGVSRKFIHSAKISQEARLDYTADGNVKSALAKNANI